MAIGTHEDERTVLYRTKSLDGTKPNANSKTNGNPKTNFSLNPNTNPIQLFYAFFRASSPDLQSSLAIHFFDKTPLINKMIARGL